jgi:hypothetical protein
MDKEKELNNKLLKIKALYHGALTQGERDSAINAKKRVLKKISLLNLSKEFKFSLDNEINASLMMDLLHRYDIQGYRKSFQEKTVVMAKAPSFFVDNILWPEYQSTHKGMCG